MKTLTGEKSNKCNSWGFASSYASDLKRHLKIHSGGKPNNCNQCKYAFSQASNLTTHLITHSGENPHNCIRCEYAFSQPGSLRTHLKTHRGEKLHTCNWCEFVLYCIEEGGGVQLRHCASLLSLSSNAGWVSCSEEVAIASAHYNLIQRPNQLVTAERLS